MCKQGNVAGTALGHPRCNPPLSPPLVPAVILSPHRAPLGVQSEAEGEKQRGGAHVPPVMEKSKGEIARRAESSRLGST